MVLQEGDGTGKPVCHATPFARNARGHAYCHHEQSGVRAPSGPARPGQAGFTGESSSTARPGPIRIGEGEMATGQAVGLTA